MWFEDENVNKNQWILLGFFKSSQEIAYSWVFSNDFFKEIDIYL